MKRLRLSSSLALPVDAATQTFLVVGKRGSGKSTTAARLVEQLLNAKVPVVVLDIADTWWGLKASRDGNGAGHDVYVFGGRHADLPLEVHGGAMIADVLCEHRVSMVLSCKHLSGVARSQFMVDFAQTLYQKWSGGVLHLVLEEAHELAPQSPPRGEKAENMLGAFKRLWKLGRSSGIGGTAITQRPASLSKDITTQSEILVVHRTIGPQDVEAVRQWIKYRQQSEEILGELATLKTGEAFVWAPEFPEDDPIGLKRVQILPRETFDSSATPKHGEQRTEPKALAVVDLERLRAKMAATIQRAKAEDPRELRRRIAELERDLKAKPAAAPANERRVEVPALKDVQVKRLEAAAGRIDRAMVQLGKWAQAFTGTEREIRNLAAEISAAIRARLATPAQPPAAPPRSASPVRAAETRPVPRGEAGGGTLGAGERRVLVAIAQHVGGVTREQITVLTGYKRSSRDTYLQRLRAAGLAEFRGELIFATDAGLATLGPDFEPLPSGDALRHYWMHKLPEGERRVLSALTDAYPRAIERGRLDEATGYQRSSRDTYLQRLRARQLVVDVGRGEVRASDQLFQGAV